VAERPHFLVVGSTEEDGPQRLARLCREAEVGRAPSWDEALKALRQHKGDALLVPAEQRPVDDLASLLQARAILEAVPDGAAVVDFDLRVRWANPAFAAWCEGPPLGRGFYEALGSPQVVGPDFCPFHTALAGLPQPGSPAEPPPAVSARLRVRCDRWIDLHVAPLSATGNPPLLAVLGRDVTPLVQQQQKLDALHRAGRELAAIQPEQLAEMSVAERVELLKKNILQSTHDILHYESIDVRLLDPRTGQLAILLQEGMGPLAVGRELFASPEGNGVSGYVGATGRSYLCPDTAADPHYLPGAVGAHSSLTVPLIHRDRVIGTFNVESPRPNAFGEDDLQFLEEFSHEIAAALKTLELLSAEKSTTASQSVEAISREVALPVDDILAAATSMLERYIGHDAEMADKIRKILVGARSIKQVIQKVGEDIAPAGQLFPAGPTATPRPPNLKGLRVLLADNDDRVRRSAHGLLGRWGCVVETARDGHEAVTMARLGTYDAIVADIRLPDVSGYEVYRRLRDAQPQARVILMTGFGYDPEHAIVKARQDGLHWVLYKPFRVDQLLDALTKPDPGPSGGVPRSPGDADGARGRGPARPTDAELRRPGGS
jgi:CheY-like chemotaxis protein